MSSNSPYILIVDDNVANLQVTTGFLRKNGYLIGLARNGTAALSQLNIRTPDLILLDIMMPDMDGLEVCKNIKRNPQLAEIPVIFLTAKNTTPDLIEGFHVGGVDYISKPFQKEELLARVKTHIELSQARKHIAELNQTKDKLYSIIAHDIKTPFSNIILLIDALRNDLIEPDSEEYRELIKRLGESTESTLSLLDNLLTWTRFQSNMQDLYPSYNDMTVMVSETVHLLRESATTKSIELKYNIPDNCLAYFDKNTLYTVLRNIISNAIKFTPQKGRIVVSVEPGHDFHKLMVQDTGIGISQEILHNIVKKDSSFTTPGTNNEPGTGLGLLVIKDFVIRNNGTFHIDSEPNVGTTVSVLLPANCQHKSEIQMNRQPSI